MASGGWSVYRPVGPANIASNCDALISNIHLDFQSLLQRMRARDVLIEGGLQRVSDIVVGGAQRMPRTSNHNRARMQSKPGATWFDEEYVVARLVVHDSRWLGQPI
jgi:hypothetical protein